MSGMKNWQKISAGQGYGIKWPVWRVFPGFFFLIVIHGSYARIISVSYLARCEKEVVICGGRTYAEKKPEDAAYYLRWQYGRKREQKSAAGP